MKVIASSLRKGNVVEMEGRLYVVLSASNFHPGKGTPTTSVDMRRISDGVKVSERWRTTEMVEKANVDDREYDFLYEDSEGWRDAFAALESDWFSPLKNALGKRVDRITLIAPTIYGELHYTLTSNDRWKFWKKAQALPAIAHSLAEQATP